MTRGRAPAAKRFRDSHHMIARLFAMGLRSGEVASRTGYSLARVSLLRNDPAFDELVSAYRSDVDEEWRESVDEYFELISANRTISARLINDKLTEAEPDDVSFRELVNIHADAADRTGYPKRSVAVNVNVDFAAQLDRAIKRSAEQRPKALPVAQALPISLRQIESGEARTEVIDEPSTRAPVVSDEPRLQRRA